MSFLCTALLLCLCLSGCSLMHRQAVGSDRDEFSSELARSDNTQLLINIVRMRYLDPPEFLQLSSITSQKTLLAGSSADIALFNPYRAKGPGTYINSNLSYSDSPTVTFTPLQGVDFVTNMCMPLSFKTIFLLCNGGWNIERLLQLSVRRFGDFYNTNGLITAETHRHPFGYYKFLKITHYFRVLQLHDSIDVHFVPNDKNRDHEYMVIKFRKTKRETAELKLKRLLNIPANARTIYLTTEDNFLPGSNVVVVKFRSIFAIMSYLADAVQVPASDVAIPQCKLLKIPMLRICSSNTPVNSMISAFYRGHYFYINEGDVQSKRTFLLLEALYQLSAGIEGGFHKNNMVLTLPLH